MKIDVLIIKNFLGIGHAEINMSKVKGLVLIEGINTDSPTSASNGAGKSSIYEALYWCLFGKTKRGLTADDVVNQFAKKDCSVEVMFYIGEECYSIRRTRKDSADGNALKLFRKVEEDWEEMTKGTIKDTQQAIEDLLKVSELTFVKTTHFGQGDVKPFATLTDKELKQIFEQALSLDFLSEMQTKVKSHKMGLTASVITQESEEAEFGRERNALEEKIDYLTDAIRELEENKAKEKARYQTEIDNIEVEIKELEESKKNLEADKAKLAELEQANSKLAELKKLQSHLDEKYEVEKTKLSEEKTILKLAVEAVDEQLQIIKESKAKVGSPCKACGRLFGEHDISGLVKTASENAREQNAKMGDIKKAVADIQVEVEKLKKLRESLLEKISVFDDDVVEETRLKSRVETLAGVDIKIEKLKKRIENYEKLIAEVDATGSDQYEKDIKAARERKAEINTLITQIKKDVLEVKDSIETAEMLEEILSNGGLKSYLLDGITPELNKLINKYMTVLDDIEVEVSTVTKLKGKEEYREKFSINVKNQHGSPIFQGNSGGEQQKVNLAISMAFNALVRGMSESPSNVLFLDEPFESLDEASSERVIELCNMLAENVGTVFLITHNATVKELVPTTLTVVKRGGKAEVRCA